MIGYEARCTECGVTFNPTGPDDLVHLERADGTPCEGQGVLLGGWTSEAAETSPDGKD